jgi:hypothetical protein
MDFAWLGCGGFWDRVVSPLFARIFLGGFGFVRTLKDSYVMGITWGGIGDGARNIEVVEGAGDIGAGNRDTGGRRRQAAVNFWT